MATPEAAGSFRQYPLPKLLFYLYRKQFTGSLFVQGGATVYLRDGIPVCGEKIEAGAGLTIEEQALAIKQRLLEQWTHLFTLDTAEFALYRQDVVVEDSRLLRVHPRRVIYHGIRTAYDVARVWKELGDALNCQSIRIGAEATTSLSRYRFTSDDQELVSKLTAGFWTPTSLVSTTGANDVDAWRLIYALWVTGMLDLRPDDEESSVTLPPRQTAQPAEPENRPGTYRFSKNTRPPDVVAERIELPDSFPQIKTPVPRTNESDQLRAKIEATASALHQLSDAELLGVTPGASREQLKAAYVTQMRMFDPDRLGLYKLEDLREEAARICGAIEASYATMMRPFFDAERHIEQGLQAIKDKRYVIAEEHFRRALELRPEDAGALEGLRLALNKKKSLFGRTRKKSD